MTNVPMEPRRYSFSSNGLDQPARSTSRRDSRAGPRHFYGEKTKKRVGDPGGRSCLRRESLFPSHEKRIQRPERDGGGAQARVVEDDEILVVELVADEWQKEDEEEVEMELQMKKEEKGELVNEEFEVKEEGRSHNVRVPPGQIVLHNNISASRCDPFPPVEV